MKKIDIKKARLSAKLTQQQAADKIFVTVRAWQRWEAGDREMSEADWELFLLKTNQHPTHKIIALN